MDNDSLVSVTFVIHATPKLPSFLRPWEYPPSSASTPDANYIQHCYVMKKKRIEGKYVRNGQSTNLRGT